MSLIDSYGRKINYLRLSVTDRCNLRCSYCMPAKGVQKQIHDDILSYEQLHRIAVAAVAIGVQKIRITGGEPLVRKGILGFLAGLKVIPGLKNLVLTTNGVNLEEMADDLRLAGVESINMSLDSLRPEVFARITRSNDLPRVLAGLAAAEKAGFKHLKINMVVMRGVNDDEVVDFAALTIKKPFNVRFIEYMPTLKDKTWQTKMVPGSELLSRLSREFRITRVEHELLDGPAAYYRIAGAVGKIGFITPMSSHFCQECNRIRVTSMGLVKSCLFEPNPVSLAPCLVAGDDAGLKDALRRVIIRKPNRHMLMSRQSDSQHYSMSQIGG